MEAILGGRVGGSKEMVEELESHLHEEMDRRVRAGQDPLAAFESSRFAQFGRPTDLVAEYARAVPAKRWLPIYSVFALVLVCFGLFAWAFLPRFLRDPLLGIHVAALVAGYTRLRSQQVCSVFATSPVGWCGRSAWHGANS